MRPTAALLTAAAGIAVALTPVRPSVAAVPASDPVGTTSATTTSPGGGSFTRSDGTLAVTDGPDGTHHATIAYSIYQPATATAATPAASLIMTHGFGLTKDSAEMVSNASFFASHGYVVLAYTAQGFGTSSGCIRLNSLDYDIADERQLLDVLQSKAFTLKDAKGLVAGVIGGSEGGGGVLPLASADPRIRATAPGRTWNTLDYSLDPNNYIGKGQREFDHLADPQGVFKLEWTSLFFAAGNAGAATGSGGCIAEKQASGDPTALAGTPCLGFDLQVCQIYAELVATGDASDADKAFLARSGAANHIDTITAPTLLVQGQSDTLFTEDDALATYTALQRKGVPVELIWNSGGHGGYDSQPGECEAYDGKKRTAADMEKCYLPQRELAWFDKWVRGRAVDAGPGFAWFEDWKPDVSAAHGGSAVGSYGSAATFPVGVTHTWQLSGTDALVPDTATTTSATVTLVNPAGGEPAAYSETANFSAPGANEMGVPVPASQLPPTELPGQNASFTTAPFTSDTDVVGTPRLRTAPLALAGTGDVYLFGKVYDVAADGSASLIHRLVAPVRIPASALGDPLDVDLPGIAHRFAAGHRLRLVLATTDDSYRNNPLPQVITLTTGAGSSLSVPVVATSAQAAAPGAKKKTVVHRSTPSVTAPTRALAATGSSPLLPLVGLVLVGAAGWQRRRARGDR